MRSALLIDACAVIEAHRVNAWEALARGWQLYVPGSVVDLEAKYFDSKYGRLPIDLRGACGTGSLVRLDADLWELETLRSTLQELSFDPKRLDIGELEAVALLFFGRASSCRLCTADAAAIEALCLCALSDTVISLERALRECGVTKPLRPHFSDSWMRKRLKRSGALAVQKRGARTVQPPQPGMPGGRGSSTGGAGDALP